MQRQMEETTKELENKEYTAASGGGAVSVTVSGKKEVVSVKLSPDVVDPDDIEMLEDLIEMCIRDRDQACQGVLEGQGKAHPD